MSNRIILITGPTSGIGKATALELARKGFDLILVARNEQKVRQLQELIGDAVKTDFIPCDLSSIASVKKAVATIKSRYSKIDVLINNAGIMVEKKELSVDGIELTFATNHIGPFALTTGLIDLLKAGDRARIVNVSSEAHIFALFDIKKLANPSWYQDLIVYGRSKFANILLSNELADRLRAFDITSNALHPGTVASNFADHGNGLTGNFMRLFRPFFKSTEHGAKTSIFLASSPEVEGITGQFFVDSKIGRTLPSARNKTLAKQLWNLSEELVTRQEKVPDIIQ